MASLYRKYRPQSFSEVVGQNHIKVTLQNEIKQDKVDHAYLFSGPRGIGKTSSARLLAKAINCEKRKKDQAEPCNKCDACREITAGNSLDIIEIDAASHTGVDNVRENIIDNARFNPNKLKNKVFIIDEVHMLSTPAFNALLKILEEPPKHVIFILCTTEIHKLPVTIVSRCQRFDFKKVSFENIVNHLGHICKKEGVNCDKDVLQNIARYSEGYLRDAIGLMGQILSLGDKKITMEQAELAIPRSNILLVVGLIEYLANRDADKALKLINRLVDEGVSLNQFSAEIVEFLRQLLLAKISGNLDISAMELAEDEASRVKKILDRFEVNKIISMINTFLEKNSTIKHSAIQQLPLEMAVVEICGGRPVKSDQEEDNSQNEESQPAEVNDNKQESLATKKEAKPSNKKQAGSGVVKLKQIKEKWSELIDTLNDSNHSMALTLRVGQPLSIEDNIVTIGFKYKFHAEMMSESKNKLTLAKTLSKILGTDLEVELVVSDEVEVQSREKAEPEDDGDVAEVAEMFEGKVV